MDQTLTLAEARARTGLSVHAASQRAGVHHTSLARWERGDRSPRARELQALAEVYQLSVWELGMVTASCS